MPDKQPAAPDVDPEVERHVEQMMDPAVPDPKPVASAGGPPPLDIFGGKAPVETVAEPAPAASEPAPEPADKPVESAEPKTPLDDAATDAAVDAIAAKESDEILANEDAKRVGRPVKKRSFKQRLHSLLRSRKTWIVVAILLVVLAVVPWTRYRVVGLVLHKTVTVTVVDSKTHTPVSNATVTAGGRHTETNASGQATFKVPVGATTLTVSKQYYHDTSESFMVGFRAPAPAHLTLTATGRQVSLTVVNKISGQPLAGVEISVLKTQAKTNAQGKTVVVLPASASTDKATLTLNGFNDATVNIAVTSQDVPANHLSLTPAGQIYFLSNLTGKIDVVKTNLDGSGRQTVLAGTGNEDPNNTSLLASRDWKYLVLESRRSGSQPGLYLISTSSGKVTQFDNSNANFTLIGWYGHNFLYDLQSNTVPNSQASHEVIKSYNADAGQLNQLDSNQEQGTANSYAYQSFGNFYLVSSGLVYTVQWYTYDTTGSGYDLGSMTDVIRGVGATGQGKKDYQTFAATTSGYVQSQLAEPNEIYYAVYDYANNKNVYYEFANQSVSTASLTQTSFEQTYPTYLVSPSGQQTFWTDLRDGKNALFVGDQNAGGGKQLATDGSYTPYGWYTENYLLMAKNSSELYVIPASGLKAGHAPLKVTDYYKPAQSFQGYGYGYGGL